MDAVNVLCEEYSPDMRGVQPCYVISTAILCEELIMAEDIPHIAMQCITTVYYNLDHILLVSL